MAAIVTDTQASEARMHRSIWMRYPNVYEIGTWVWLNDLSRKYQKKVDLSSVPATEWDEIAAFGFDAVWLMGVWERSPAGIAIAKQNQSLLHSFRQALPDVRDEDIVGSPYCIRRYVVDDHLGGPEGLAIARTELARRGMKLVLDFVPNHVAPDHPWATEHPEYFVRGNADDLAREPASYLRVSGTIYACGRDPFFPAWPDVLQLNAFNDGLRLAVRKTVLDIAEQCDGVRCDMAMLLLNSVFARTWEGRVGPAPAAEYWEELIPTIRSRFPGFLFIAEAYWDLEWALQQLGFDFCYDKRLYDRLEHSAAEDVRLHLCADLAYQEKLVRFIENHDEPRAASAFSAEKECAVALVALTLPGLKLLHEGQFDGRKVRLPVFLGRRPDEVPDSDLRTFYAALMKLAERPTFHIGRWRLRERTGWPDNSTFQNLVAWTWEHDERFLVVVNLSDRASQARITLSWPDLKGQACLLTDHLAGTSYERDGTQLLSSGLFVDLAPWGYHLFQFRRSATA